MSTSENPPAPPASPAQPPVAHRGWLIFFGGIVLVAALCFVVKFYEFFYDLSRQEGFRFAGAHLATYLLVAGGFFLLLLYAFLKGHFSDIERPKLDLLERERRLDHDEFA